MNAKNRNIQISATITMRISHNRPRTSHSNHKETSIATIGNTTPNTKYRTYFGVVAYLFFKN